MECLRQMHLCEGSIIASKIRAEQSHYELTFLVHNNLGRTAIVCCGTLSRTDGKNQLPKVITGVKFADECASSSPVATVLPLELYAVINCV
jgi:hypothetical protein